MNVFYIKNARRVWKRGRGSAVPVNFEYFKVFYYVAKYRCITQAAEALSLTQPSVTRSIQSLEAQLGCSLFHRSKKGVTLTNEGQMIFQRIFTACDLMFSAEEELEQLKHTSTGIVRIGTDDLDIRQDYMLALAERFRAQYPEVKLRIVQRDGAELTEALEAGTLDFCILADASTGQAEEFTPDLEYQVLNEYQDVVIVGEAYAHLAGREITLRELAPYPLIVWVPGTASRRFFEELYRRHGLVMAPAVETANIAFQMLLTERGFGYSFVPRHCAEEKIRQGRLFPLRLANCPLSRRLLLLTSKTRPLSLTAQKFLRLLRQTGGEGTPWPE